MNLNFEFSVDDTNLIIHALVKFPYEQVATLVDNIRQQGERQMTTESVDSFEEAEVSKVTKTKK